MDDNLDKVVPEILELFELTPDDKIIKQLNVLFQTETNRRECV